MYPMKNQMISERETEIGFYMNASFCCSRFIKKMARENIARLNWEISRIMKDKSIDNPPSTK